jgi:glycerophosphoryl diester phosphodiesterase
MYFSLPSSTYALHCPPACCSYGLHTTAAETKHPAWHNSLPALKAANTTIEQLVADALKAKGYASSAPYNSSAWRARPLILQSFEINSLRRLSDLMPGVPLAYLLDDTPDPETRQSLSQLVSYTNLDAIKSFVSIVAPWKGLLYNASAAEAGEQEQQLQSTGLAARLKDKGFMVHTYTLRDEAQFVPGPCKADITCEFEFLFKQEGIDGAFADYPATLVQWVQQNY